MSETIAHTRLVKLIVEWLSAEYTSVQGLSLFCDCPTVVLTEKPAPIEGFFPDICAITTPQTITVIGEAKTLWDLETKRSFNQFLAFFRFLAVRPGPVFVVAVPWQGIATAKNLLRAAQTKTNADGVDLKFLVG